MKIFWMAAALLCALTALTTASARADILFIGLNAGADELKAVQAAARQRGERVIAIPEIPLEARESLASLKMEIARNFRQNERIIRRQVELTRRGITSPSAYEALNREMTAVSISNTKVGESMTALQERYLDNNVAAELEHVLSKAELEGRRLGSLVVSAHAGSSMFFGDFSEAGLRRQELYDLLDRHPKARDGIRSIMLWGCYTTTRDKVRALREHAPNANVIMGYWDKAPGAQQDDSARLLEAALREERALSSVTDLKGAVSAFRRLPAVLETHSAASFNGCYVGTGLEPERLAMPSVRCRSARAQLAPGLVDYKAFVNGEAAGHGDVPSDTHHSVLRDFYSELQQFAECREELADMPSPDRVLPLIFFRNVEANYAAYHRDELERMAGAMRRLGLGGSPLLLLGPGAGRAQVLAFLNRAEAQARRLIVANELRRVGSFFGRSTPLSADHDRDLDEVAAGVLKMRRLLDDLSCVPFSWITERPVSGHKPAAPTCS